MEIGVGLGREIESHKKAATCLVPCKMSPSNSSLTNQEIWTRSDKYHNSFLLEKDDALDASLKTNNAEGLPDIAVTPAQGKFLMLLASSMRAKHILEVGTLGG